MDALSNLSMLMNMPKDTISSAVGFFVSDLVLDRDKFTCKNLNKMINKEYIMDQIRMFIDKRVTESSPHFNISKENLILKINTFFTDLLNESTWSSAINSLSTFYNCGSIDEFIKYRVIEVNS